MNKPLLPVQAEQTTMLASGGSGKFLLPANTWIGQLCPVSVRVCFLENSLLLKQPIWH